MGWEGHSPVGVLGVLKMFYLLLIVLAGLRPGLWPRPPLAGGPPYATVAMKGLEWTEGSSAAQGLRAWPKGQVLSENRKNLE